MNKAGSCALLVALASCTPDNRLYEQELREVLDGATIGLAHAIREVEQRTTAGSAVRARLHVVGERWFTVDVIEDGMPRTFAVARSGGVVTADGTRHRSGSTDCGPKTLAELVEVAQERAGGRTVAIEPLSACACAYRAQVLTSSELMAVDVFGTGEVADLRISNAGWGEDDD
ncbi:MAG: hypothetical protein RIF41_20375 [Polyangiaceae bacterium]